mgnify:FL=1
MKITFRRSGHRRIRFVHGDFVVPPIWRRRAVYDVVHLDGKRGWIMTHWPIWNLLLWRLWTDRENRESEGLPWGWFIVHRRLCSADAWAAPAPTWPFVALAVLGTWVWYRLSREPDPNHPGGWRYRWAWRWMKDPSSDI